MEHRRYKRWKTKFHLNLKIWEFIKKIFDFINEAYNECSNFPKEEIYRLSSQFIRTEGSGSTDAQLNRFLQLAITSVRECVAYVAITKKKTIYQKKIV